MQRGCLIMKGQREGYGTEPQEQTAAAKSMR